MEATILHPGDSLTYSLSAELREEPLISVIPRPQSLQWLIPTLTSPNSGNINLLNSSTLPIVINKGDHIADLRSTILVEPPTTSPYNGVLVHEDKFQFADMAQSRVVDQSELSKIQVDPDCILTPAERDIFYTLHKRFAHLFSKQPGKYNG